MITDIVYDVVLSYKKENPTNGKIRGIIYEHNDFMYTASGIVALPPNKKFPLVGGAHVIQVTYVS